MQASAVIDNRAKSWTKLRLRIRRRGGRGNRTKNVRTKLEDGIPRTQFQQRPRADLVLRNRLVPNRGDSQMAPGDTTVGRRPFTRDHLEPSLLVRRPNITAIDAHRDRTIGRVGEIEEAAAAQRSCGQGSSCQRMKARTIGTTFSFCVFIFAEQPQAQQRRTRDTSKTPACSACELQ